MHKGFIRNRIESRIAGIRNRSRQDSTGRSNSASSGDPTVSGSMPTFSQLERLHSADGFLVVDEAKGGGKGEDKDSVGREGDQDDEEEEMAHMALEQRVDDPLSDMDGDLEGLVIPDEEEEEEGDEPRPKRGAKAKEEVVKPWLEGNKEVYEQQLELLQEHLTDAMLTNQNLQCE